MLLELVVRRALSRRLHGRGMTPETVLSRSGAIPGLPHVIVKRCGDVDIHPHPFARLSAWSLFQDRYWVAAIQAAAATTRVMSPAYPALIIASVGMW
jgi:hypothetical protein